MKELWTRNAKLRHRRQRQPKKVSEAKACDGVGSAWAWPTAPRITTPSINRPAAEMEPEHPGGVDSDRSRATTFDAGRAADVESHGAHGGYGGPAENGDGRSPGGGYGSPRNNPIFSSADAGPQSATAGAFQPTPPISPANRAGLPPLSEGAARFGEVAGQRTLLARLGKNRGTRPLGSGGYT